MTMMINRATSARKTVVQENGDLEDPQWSQPKTFKN